MQVSMNFSQNLQTALADDLFLLGQISLKLSSLAPSCAVAERYMLWDSNLVILPLLGAVPAAPHGAYHHRQL